MKRASERRLSGQRREMRGAAVCVWRRASACRLPFLAATLGAALVVSGCARLVFHPEPTLIATPADWGHPYLDVTVTTRDGIALHGWLIEPEGVPVGTLYFLHGNAQNISTHTRSVLWLVASGYRVFAIDYRGYGLSEGEPGLPEVLEDVRAGAAWLFDHLDGKGDAAPVHLLGQSLGGALALRYLARHPEHRERFEGAIIEAAFTGYGAMAQHVARGNALTWLFAWPAERLFAGPDDPIDAVDSLAPLPLMIVHSRDDRIVPFTMGEALHAAAGEPKVFHETLGPHVAAWREPRSRAAMLDFLGSEQPGREPEESHDTDHVSDGGQRDATRQRRIDAQAFHHRRQGDARVGCREQVDDQGRAENEPDAGFVEPHPDEQRDDPCP